MKCPRCNTTSESRSAICAKCGLALGDRIIPYARVYQSPSSRRASAALELEYDDSAPQRVLRAILPNAQWQNTSQVTGRVIAVDGPHLEPADFDLYAVLNRTIWLLLLAASPVLVVYSILIGRGALPALLALVGVIYLMKFLTPMNLFAIFHLARHLNPLRRSQVEQVPVRYMRIREHDTLDEHIIRIKGNLAAGNIMADDRITAYGSFKNGVFRTEQAYSHRTGAWIQTQQSRSWLRLSISLLVVVLLFAMFYLPALTLWFVRS